jgi:protein O-mannosyl-transferase
MNVPFYGDDINNVKNPILQIDEITWGNFKNILDEATLHTRPVSNISFALNYYFGGYRVQGYHLVNTVIHILSGYFLFLLVRLTLSLPVNREKYEKYTVLPFITALIWLAHPLATQSVTYIVQRMNSMCAMFFVLSLLLYIYARLQDSERQRKFKFVVRSSLLFFLSLLSGLLALGSKEIAATLPILIFFYEFYFFQNLSLPWLKKRVLWPMSVVLVIGGIIISYLGKRPWEVICWECLGRDFTAMERVYTQFKVVVTYIYLLVYPNYTNLALDRDFPISTSLFTPIDTFVAFLAVGGLIAAMMVLAKKERLLSFCILWFLVNLAIESSFICLEIIFEHRTYLPSMFFLLFIVLVLYRFIPFNRVVTIFLFVVVMLFSYWTISRNNVWADPVEFWQSSIELFPEKARPHRMLAHEYMKVKRYEEAEKELSLTISLDSRAVEAYNNLGIVMLQTYRLKEAERYFREALARDAKNRQAIQNLGSLLIRLDKLKEAEQHYRKYVELFPDNRQLNFLLGRVLGRQGKPDEALYYLEKSSKEGGEDSEKILMETASVLLMLNRKNEAKDVFEAVIKDYSSATAHYNLALLLAQGGDNTTALVHFEMAEMLSAERPPISYNMGNALLNTGEIEKAKEKYIEFLQIVPTVGDSFNNLGLAYSYEGQYEMAAQFFAKALFLKPDDTMIRSNLELAKELMESEGGRAN